MNRRLGQGLFILSLLFLAFGLFSIGWVVWPTPREAVTLEIPAGLLPGAPGGASYASLTDYGLSLTRPRWLRVGERGEIRVYLREQDAQYSIELDQPVQVVLVETSLAKMSLDPPGLRQVSLHPGQEMDLSWEVSGDATGEFPGQVIFSFAFYDEAHSDLIPVPVAVMDYEIKVISLFGMERNIVLWLGFVGVVLWGVLFVIGRAVQH
ncbi:MAG TPA: hypothetical protein VIM80_05330 [Brevefilum sp.]